MDHLISEISKINNIYSLIAFIVAVIYYIVAKNRQKGWVIGGALAVILLIGLAPILASTYIKSQGIYRIRVTVIGTEGIPIEDAKVWSNGGGESKKVSGGWEIVVPPQTVPLDKKLTIYAAKEDAFLKGKAEIVLKNDYNPIVTINLYKGSNAEIAGIVKNSFGSIVDSVLVFVVGYGTEAVFTKNGSFHLSAHASNGQRILLHAEKSNKTYEPYDNYITAGDTGISVILKTKSK